ncbi:MAG: hypothetical protein ACYC9S_11655 [Leptospirales bacterium]
MRDFFSNDQLTYLLLDILEESDPRVRVYVYRMVNDRPLKLALNKGEPFPKLLEYLRDEYGGGAFRLLIRRGETMILSGVALIWSPRQTDR